MADTEYQQLASTSSKATIPKLQGASNYKQWSMLIESYLRKEGCWRACTAAPIKKDKKEDNPAEAAEDTKAVPPISADAQEVKDYFAEEKDDSRDDYIYHPKNEAVRFTILQTCNNTTAARVKYLRSAFDMWNKLKTLYGGTTAAQKMALFSRLWSQSLSKCSSLAQYLNKVQSCVEELAALDVTIPEEQVVSFTIIQLGDSFTDFQERTIIEGVEGLTLEKLAQQLNEIDSIQQERNKTTTAALQQKGSRNQHGSSNASNKRNPKKVGPPWPTRKEDSRTGKWCSHCKKDNHNGPDNCYTLHPEKAPPTWGAGRSNESNNQHQQSQTQGSTPTFHARTKNWLATIVSNVSTELAGDTSDDWYLDTGAQDHIVNNPKWFTSTQSCNYTIKGVTAEDSITVQGSAKLPMDNGQEVIHCNLKDALLYEGSPVNLLSVGKLEDAGFRLNTRQRIIEYPDGKPLGRFERIGRLYKLLVPAEETAVILATRVEAPLPTWHRRLGHLGYDNLQKLLKGTGIQTTTDQPDCEACALTKLTAKPYQRLERSKHEGDKIHSDFVFPVTPTAYDGSRGWISFTDDYTRMKYCFTFKKKSEVVKLVQDFVVWFETHRRRIRTFHSDDDRTYSSGELGSFFKSKGIAYEPTVPYTPQQNGLSEVGQYHIHQKASAMLEDAGLPKFLWPAAVKHAIYLGNRSPAALLPSAVLTPYQATQGKKPDLSYLRIWGSKAYSLLPKAKRVQSQKFHPKSTAGRLVGFEGDGSIALIWNEGTRSVGRTRSYAVHEDVPYTGDPMVQQELEELSDEDLKKLIRFDKPPAAIEQPAEAALEELHGNDYTAPQAAPPVASPGRTHQTEGDRMSQLHRQLRELSAQYVADRPEIANMLEAARRRSEINAIQGELDDSILSEEGNRSDRSDTGSVINVWTPADELQRESSLGDELAALPPTISTLRRSSRRRTQLFASIGPYINKALEANKACKDFNPIETAIEQGTRSYIGTNIWLSFLGSNDLSIKEPRSFAELLKAPDSEEWWKALGVEFEAQLKNRTWKYTKLKDLPSGTKLLTGKWVLKYKRDSQGKITKYKARWVARGFLQQYGLDYDETFAGVVKTSSFRILFAIIAFYDLHCEQVDFLTAFLNGTLSQPVYMEQPPGFAKQGPEGEALVCEVVKGLYGLKQSAREWFKTITSFLRELGFAACPADECVMIQGDVLTGIVCTLYVDDFKIISSDMSQISKLKKQLAQRFKITDMGPVQWYLGIAVKRDRKARTINLSQKSYFEKVLTEFDFAEGRTAATPAKPGEYLSRQPEYLQASEQEVKHYQQLLGSITYAAIETRPDLAYATGVTAQFAHNPSPVHLTALKAQLRYLRGTTDYSITYGGTGTDTLTLEAYSDADWGGDRDTRKSTSGYLFMLNGGPVSWSSKRQATVALSTTEAEYMALKEAIKEASWIRQFFADLGLNENQAIAVNCDNKGAIALGKNPEFHKRTKHIDIQYHYVRQEIDSGRITTPYLETSKMLADALTKPVPGPTFKKFVKDLRLNL